MKVVAALTFFLSLNVFSQNEFFTKSSVDLLFSTKSIKGTELSSDLNSFDNIQFGRPINYVGISLTSGLTVNRISRSEGGYPLDGHFEYLYLIPQSILIQDSLEAKIKGFNVGITLAGVDLIASLGFNTGRVSLKGQPEIKQKNPYFAPFLSVTPRICLNRLSMYLRASYDYDISNKEWKRKGFKDTDIYELNSFKYHGFNLAFGLGYILQ